ncbi:hypothetical protein BST42_03575 [Mycolicibacterium rhodesiae]|uniref:Secreted protein n=1 Tax=Mycolicibacterium rhodesiae TaxID=36814 RepID=A0A1X0J641_MYCRH|nr:hypothetical protein [Mycolicibacterium rhodesiae]ORB57450.1 hypothetical protein BST42_03575 [Mycolicibacterium rhodesiae]
MTLGLSRFVRIVLGALAAAAFLLAPTALIVAPAGQATPVPQGCYNGVIPWNPYLKSCSLPSTQPRVRGAAPDATAIIACHNHPGCLSWYVNGGP